MPVSRTWNGADADFYTPADWMTAAGATGYPLPGDTAVVGGGTVQFVGREAKANNRYDNLAVSLGTAGGPAATLLFTDALAGQFFTVSVTGNAVLAASGASFFAGGLTDTSASGKLTLSSTADQAGVAGNFVLLRGASVTLAGGAGLDLEGVVTLERSVTLNAADPMVNNAAVTLLGGTFDIRSSSYTGTGTVNIGVATTAFFEGAVPATQTVSFTGGDGKLKIAAPAQFAGRIAHFAPEAVIDLTAIAATAASYSPATRTITVSNNGTTVAMLANVDGAAGALVTASDSSGGTTITYAGTGTRLSYQIGAAAHAERADIAQTMTVPGTNTLLTGAGVRIRIISDSFDVVTPGSANADAALGYLPAKADGTSAVRVLQEGAAAGAEDEGRAMAELVHQIAPGAAIDFYTGVNGAAAFATGVTALQQAGCNIIVDDITVRGSEPFFQVAGPLDTAIANAVAAGTSYFTLASNYGDAYYEHAFTTSAQTLLDGSAVQAMSFSNGTPYQSITLSGATTTTIDLQWDAAFYGSGGAAAADAVAFKLFDANGTLIGTSSQKSIAGQLVAESELVLTLSAAINVRIALYQNAATPVGLVKYMLFGKPTGAQTAGGTINDPDAGIGGGMLTGHALVPGAVTVAAVFAGNTAAYGQAGDVLEPFSASGPGEILFDAAGNRLATPQSAGKLDVTGVDGVETSLAAFFPFFGTSAASPDVAAVAALMLQANPNLAPAQIKAALKQSSVSLGQPAAAQGSGLVQADQAVLLAENLACFAQGTRIATLRGEVAVEALRPGDLCLTLDGAAAVTWVGHRHVVCAGLARAHEAWPVRIAPDAFGPGLPTRELFLSPDHGVFAEGVLIPVRCLVNGRTVVPHPVPAITYWHVELAAHAVLLAEGLPAESYRDTGSRSAFDGATATTSTARMLATASGPSSSRPMPSVQRNPGSAAWKPDSSRGSSSGIAIPSS